MATREQIVKQAQEWLGRNEAAGTHKAIIDTYNQHLPQKLPRGYAVDYEDEWCATFVSSVAIKCGATDIIPKECSCTLMIELFKSLSSWQEADNYIPSPGDILFYDWQDKKPEEDNRNSPDHVGIVEKVEGGFITIIEGNYSKSVKRRAIEINGKYIRGYGIPKYKAAANYKLTTEEVAKEVILGKWGSGLTRRIKLAAAGYDYTEVQGAVNRLLTPRKSIDAIAREVIRGDWGSGNTRKKKLTAAGYDYNEVQKVVNRLLK